MYDRAVTEMVSAIHDCTRATRSQSWPGEMAQQMQTRSELADLAADLLTRLDAEVVKLRAEVGDVMRREKKMRRSFSKWTHRLNRRIERLKANIADEEAYIELLRARIADLTPEPETDPA